MARRIQEKPHQDHQQRQADELDPARDHDPRRPAEGAHTSDRTAVVTQIRPPDWDWSWATDGTLALNPDPAFGTFPRMPQPVASRRARATRRRHVERERRLRRLALLCVVAIIAIVTLSLSAFGGGGTPTQAPAPASASRLLPAGLQLPVSQSRVTAIGYQGGSAGAQAIDPLGTQANQGLLRRLVRSVFGGSNVKPRWYQLPGGEGPATSALEVGAAAGTDVYSPVDGTVLSIGDVIMNGRVYGSRIDVQPTGAPSLVVSVSHVRVDQSLVVGSPVTAGGSKLGSIVDFSGAERQALARYTNDPGNHVVVEVHPAATSALG